MLSIAVGLTRHPKDARPTKHSHTHTRAYLQLEDDVELVLVVERIVQLNQPGMVQAAHDVDLAHHVAPVLLLLVGDNTGCWSLVAESAQTKRVR